MTTAILFPGQGIEIPGLIAEWHRGSCHAARLLDVAAAACGHPLHTLLRLPPAAPTELLQPVLTALLLAAYTECAQRDVAADVVAGHSAGEIAACAVAGAWSFEAAIGLSARRGRLMAREARRFPGGMIAVRDEESEVLALVEQSSSTTHPLSLAAHNAPGEWVLSGDRDAIRAVVAARQGTPIATTGAWHTPHMAAAVAPYEADVRATRSGSLRLPFVSNRHGGVVADAAELPALLSGQLVTAVRWTACMRTMGALGVDRVVVCGPGKALRRFAHAVLPDVVIDVVATPDDLRLLDTGVAA